ncbi:MAG: hypothetical protein KBC30_05745 [Planctomycetes bacterium]|jgi:hypothetical protein|nr:hypothetical protein [Planctomycetota bacterium]HPY75159.1 hypothetical protein [Planctomycetota bacterium]HQB00766.1 hypothetical protein [Planctomycetota bacterium]
MKWIQCILFVLLGVCSFCKGFFYEAPEYYQLIQRRYFSSLSVKKTLHSTRCPLQENPTIPKIEQFIQKFPDTWKYYEYMLYIQEQYLQQGNITACLQCYQKAMQHTAFSTQKDYYTYYTGKQFQKYHYNQQANNLFQTIKSNIGIPINIKQNK